MENTHTPSVRDLLRGMNDDKPKCQRCGKPQGQMRIMRGSSLETRQQAGVCACGPDPVKAADVAATAAALREADDQEIAKQGKVRVYAHAVFSHYVVTAEGEARHLLIRSYGDHSEMSSKGADELASFWKPVTIRKTPYWVFRDYAEWKGQLTTLGGEKLFRANVRGLGELKLWAKNVAHAKRLLAGEEFRGLKRVAA